MFARLLSLPVMLAAVIGVPYLATNGPNIDGLFDNQAAPSQQTEQPPQETLKDILPPKPKLPSVPQGPGATLYPIRTPLEGVTKLSLPEVLNFNITKEWVYQHWSRKSTGLSDLGHYGVRVPLVTGTELYDLAGSLTYFFSPNGQLSRISFRGTTGDTTQLIMIVTQQLGLQRQPTPVAGEQLFQTRQQNLVFSEVKTRPAPVLWASSPHDSFAVEFDLQRPGTTTPLPSRLPPLPEVQSPPPAPETQTAAAPEPTEAAAAEEKDVDPAEKWKAFFPRSRVPEKQVNGLNRRGRMW